MDSLDVSFSDPIVRRLPVASQLLRSEVGLFNDDRTKDPGLDLPKRSEAPLSAESSKNADDAKGHMNDLLIAVGDRGDKDAFRELFKTFSPRFRAFIGQRGQNPDMSEEVVQETFIRVWKKAQLFDPEKASASTWLFAIARNTRIDILRKRGRPAPDADDPSFVPDPEPGADQLISREEEAKRLQKAIALLPPDQREVLQLAYFEEKAHARVAEDLGIPLGTVKSRIRLALGRIRTELRDLR
jgi:RNA polymerase sigma-70 factor (ECF subfamily)